MALAQKFRDLALIKYRSGEGQHVGQDRPHQESRQKEYKRRMPVLVKPPVCCRKPPGAQVPVIILFEGWDAAGKTSIQTLTERLDPRLSCTQSGRRTREEAALVVALGSNYLPEMNGRSSTAPGMGGVGGRGEVDPGKRMAPGLPDIADFARPADDGYR
jgi:hypothetical protein